MAPELTRRRVLRAAGTATALSLAGCATADDGGDAWPQLGATVRRTSHNPAASGPRSNPTVDWSVRTNGQALSGGVVASDTAYFNGGGVAAYAVDGGDRTWRTSLPFDSGIPPVVGRDHVFVAGRHALHAVDPDDGTRAWERSLGDQVLNTPGFDGSMLFVGFRSATQPHGASLHALDPDSGTAYWSADVGRDDVLLFTPAVADGLVAVGKERVYAFDAATGERRWTFDVPEVRFGTPAITGGVVYVGGSVAGGSGVVFALDAADGTERWRVETGRGARSLAVANGTVYVASDHVYALDAADGTERWRYDADRFLHAAPAVAGGRVYLGGLLGEVVALDAADGAEAWTVRTQGLFMASPAVAGDAAYVAGKNGVAVRIVEG